MPTCSLKILAARQRNVHGHLKQASAFEAGFVNACVENGVDPDALVKAAQAAGQANQRLKMPVASTVGAGKKSSGTGAQKQYNPMSSHSDDKPDSMFKYLRHSVADGNRVSQDADSSSRISGGTYRPWPLTHTINPVDILRPVYGSRLNQELVKAQGYAHQRRLPWASDDFNKLPSTRIYSSPSDRYPYNQTIPVAEGSPAFIPTRRTVRLPPRGSSTRLDLSDSTANGPSMGLALGEYSDTTIGTLKHEITGHALHPIPKRGKLPVPGSRVTWLDELQHEELGQPLSYPEIAPSELTPPASAIQQHLFNTTGRRLESPEAYDEWIRLAGSKAFDRTRLPTEVQRWLNYRDLALQDPNPESKANRLQYLDSNMRHIIPGIVRRDNPRSQVKLASAVTPYELGTLFSQQRNVHARLKQAYDYSFWEVLEKIASGATNELRQTTLNRQDKGTNTVPVSVTGK